MAQPQPDVVDDPFAELEPGRRLQYAYPSDRSYAAGNNASRIEQSEGRRQRRRKKEGGQGREDFSVVVLDAPERWNVAAPCAAMIVPEGREEDWIYSSEGGQWQLVASAAVARLILVSSRARATKEANVGEQMAGSRRRKKSRRSGDVKGSVECLGRRELAGEQMADKRVELQKQLRPLVISLAPRVSFEGGDRSIPFVEYEDDVLKRKILAQVASPITGGIIVEDVAVRISKRCSAALSDGTNQDTAVFQNGDRCADALSDAREDARSIDHGHIVVLRRRMRFQRMPNLIQSEVPLLLRGNFDARSITDEPQLTPEADADKIWESYLQQQAWEPDYSRLVHKYLPPIVAGLSLVADALDKAPRPRALILGGGAFALPIYLRKHTPFDVHVVEHDKTIINLASTYFKLEPDDHLHVHEIDAATYVRDISEEVREARDSKSAQSKLFHAVVLDLDEAIGSSNLMSPPAKFLEEDFLKLVRSVLHEDGILTVNLVPISSTACTHAMKDVMTCFKEVYVNVVEDDVNLVLHALPSQSHNDPSFVSPWKRLVCQEHVDDILPITPHFWGINPRFSTVGN